MLGGLFTVALRRMVRVPSIITHNPVLKMTLAALSLGNVGSSGRLLDGSYGNRTEVDPGVKSSEFTIISWRGMGLSTVLSRSII